MQALSMSDRSAADRRISFAVCLQVLLVGVKNMLIQAFEELYEDNVLLNTLLFVAVAVAYILAYVSLGDRMVSFSPMTLMMVAFVVISVVASALINPIGIVRYPELFGYFLPFCFLTAFMITRLSTLEWIAYYMERFSYIIIVASLICVVTILQVGHTTTSDWSTYSMSMSNVIVVAVMWMLYCYFEKHSTVALIMAAVGILSILLCGSRNPLLAIMSYVIIKTFIKVFSKKTPNRERWICVGWSVAIVLFFLFFGTVIRVANYVIAELGIYSRSIGLLESDLLFDSGRLSIHRSLITALNRRPILGLGIGGDMEIIDWAAHNFFLSVLSTYGYPLGLFILAVLAVLLVRAFRRSRGISREILMLYACLFLPRSLTGSDIWRSDMPWWLFACVIVVLTSQAESGDSVPPVHQKKNEESAV